MGWESGNLVLAALLPPASWAVQISDFSSSGSQFPHLKNGAIELFPQCYGRDLVTKLMKD